jgi:hypothetical protein
VAAAERSQIKVAKGSKAGRASKVDKAVMLTREVKVDRKERDTPTARRLRRLRAGAAVLPTV